MAADGTQHPIEAREHIKEALRPYFDREVQKERAWGAEQKRTGGVCQSGMSETSRRPRTIRDLIRDAEFERQRAEDSRQAYLASAIGKARSKIAEGCRKAESLHAALHDVGSALSRGDGSASRKAEDAAAVMRELRQAVADLETFVRLVGAA